MSKNLLEFKEYKFEGVTLSVKLDRRAKKLSFVEWNAELSDYVTKNWQFVGRELSYMNGWLNILEAMKYVINDCKKVMESWDDEETEDLIKLLSQLDDESVKGGK